MTGFEHVVVVGASLAGLRVAETLRRESYTGRLTLVGDEDELPYDRPPLSKDFLSGKCDARHLRLSVGDQLDADWRLGSAAVRLDPDRRVVALASGEEVSYDALVVATGSRARQLLDFDPSSPSVHSVRSLADASRLRDALGRGVRLLVVGCGFVGIETASTVRSLGAEVTVVGIDPPVAPAGPLAVTRAQQLLAEAGVSVHVGHTVTSVTENANSFDVVLSDGTALQVDEVVVSIGSIPNVDWLAGSGADTRNGVACDEFLRVVGLDDVYAAGDIVSWPNAAFSGQQMRVEHWSNAAEQGTAAARNLLAATASRKPFGTVPSFWSDHFGTKLQSVGVPRLADRFEVVAGDVESGSFCAEAYAGDVLVGGVSYGMPREIVRIRLALTRAGVALLPVSG